MHLHRQSKLRADGNGESVSLSSPPASEDLPGNAVSCLHSLVEGKNFCHQWGSMRMREKRRLRDLGICNIRLPVWRRLHLSVGRLLKESNSNQCSGDKGGVVLAESTVMLLSLGKLRRFTPDACSPNLRESVASKSGELQGKRVWSHTNPHPSLGSHQTSILLLWKNGDSDTYLEAVL